MSVLVIITWLTLNEDPNNIVLSANEINSSNYNGKTTTEQLGKQKKINKTKILTH